FLTLDNQIDVQTGTVKAKARFANREGVLFPNQFVNVRMLLRTIDAAVVVPVIALRHGPNGDFVYVVNADRTVSLRNVKAGVAGVDNVEITQGLAIGEVVVTEGGDRLRDGARIQTSADRAAAASTPGGAPAEGKGPSAGRGQFGGRRGARAEGVQPSSPPAGTPSPPGAGQTAPTGEVTGPVTSGRRDNGTTRGSAPAPK
ncbi:MAG TPA: efflux RND transporter periplasmic adaptor subunit, partial [Casimicrobiaceae bacterium]|nr:efflux RND transporter periplasmic adaptor subunit [Casimicrobiaceae bacterium]